MVSEVFEEIRKNMDIISAAFFTEKEKKEKESKIRVAPLTDYIDRIAIYKEEL